jgi:two-component system cell cycle response regulator DivK
VGHEVLEAKHADEGLPMVREEKPDLVIMDIRMPGTDGLTALRLLKADEATSSIPVLVLTAHAMPGDRRRFLDAGCDAYLPKPFRYRPFLELVEQLLNTKAG